MSFCLRCRHTRRGLPAGAVCPECGDPPPPVEWVVIDGLTMRFTAWRAIALIVPMLIPLLLICVAVLRGGNYSSFPSIVSIAAALGFVAIIASIVVLLRRQESKSSEARLESRKTMPPIVCSASGVGFGLLVHDWSTMRAAEVIDRPHDAWIGILFRGRRIGNVWYQRWQRRDSETITAEMPRIDRWRVGDRPRSASDDRCVGCDAMPRSIAPLGPCSFCGRPADDPSWCVVRGAAFRRPWIPWLVGAASFLLAAAVYTILLVPFLVLLAVGLARFLTRHSGERVAWIAMPTHLEIRRRHLRFVLPWSEIRAIKRRPKKGEHELHLVLNTSAVRQLGIHRWSTLVVRTTEADRFLAVARVGVSPAS